MNSEPPPPVPNNPVPRLLACCRVSIRELDIFRLWLLYYGKRVDCIAALIVAEEGDDCRELEALCLRSGAIYRTWFTHRFHPDSSMEELRKLVHGTPADWIIHTDSDEFLGGNFRRIAELLAEEHADYAEGTMIDRLAANGTLRSLENIANEIELEHAFPVRALVTSELARGCIRKVCFCRWPQTGSMHAPGHSLHHKSRQRLFLDHYKWRIGLEERLRKRVANHRASHLPWGTESERILGELAAYGRIRAERWPAPAQSPADLGEASDQNPRTGTASHLNPGSKTADSGRRGVSFCTICKGRREHLAATLPENLKTLRGRDAELILLDWQSADGLDEWISVHFREELAAGLLHYYQLQSALPFSLPVAKNFAHRFARKEIVINLDADNFIGNLWEAAQALAPDEFLACEEFRKGSFGRIGFWRDSLVNLGGYDESFEPAGHYDVDLVGRALRRGLRKLPITCSKQAIQHDKSLTLRFMGGGGEREWRQMEQRNSARSQQSLAEGRVAANTAGFTSADFVYNFHETPRLGSTHFFFSAETDSSVLVAEPLVSAMMVTGHSPERAWLAGRALECFVQQTWRNAELVVVTHPHSSISLAFPETARALGRRLREIFVPEGATLGELRNHGLHSCAGEWVMLWDDDDWHHPHRIAEQMKHARRDAPVLLGSQIRYSLRNHTGFVHRDTDGIHGTYLHHRSAGCEYPRIPRGEDTAFLRHFSRRIVLENDPSLFIRFVHGYNTWDEQHIMRAYAGRRNLLDLTPDLVALLSETVLPLYSRAAGSASSSDLPAPGTELRFFNMWPSWRGYDRRRSDHQFLFSALEGAPLTIGNVFARTPQAVDLLFSQECISELDHDGSAFRWHGGQANWFFGIPRVDHPNAFWMPYFYATWAKYRGDHKLQNFWQTPKQPGVSVVISNLTRGNLAKKRAEIAHQLSHYLPVYANRALSAGAPADSKVIYCDVPDKLAFIARFTHHLCFENSSFPGYFTEKLFDALFVGAVPLYAGDPLAGEWIAPAGYLACDGLDAAAIFKLIEEHKHRASEIAQQREAYCRMPFEEMANRLRAFQTRVRQQFSTREHGTSLTV